MKNNHYLLNYRFLRKSFVCILFIINGFGLQVILGQRAGYITGDFHQHTTYTDGSYSFDYVMEKNNEFNLDWWANSEHGGYRDRDARYSGIDLDTTVYWDQESDVNILGDTIYRGSHQAMWRWQNIMDYSFQSTLKARSTYPDKMIIQGLEWNVPGHEHGSVAIISGQFCRKPNANALSEFEYKFDNADYDQTGGAEMGWTKSTLSGHEKTLEAIEWLQENHRYASWVVPAHPERAASYDINHFRDMNNAGPDVCFGFESMPGHQKSKNRGGYRSSTDGGGTYGGCGYYAGKIGGLWDAMLSEGRRWWLFASSDFHSLSGDFWPGEYQKTYTWVTNKYNPYSIVRGLRSGNSWVVEGDLIDELNFMIFHKSRRHRAWATMGQTLYTRKNDVMIKIIVNDPADTNNFGGNPVLDHIDLIMGKVTGLIDPSDENYGVDEVSTTKVIARFDENGGITDDNGLTSVAWKRIGKEKIMIFYKVKDINEDCYFRLRGTNKTLNEYYETDGNGNPLLDILGENTIELVTSDLWFYSNPIFVQTMKRHENKYYDNNLKSGETEIAENSSPENEFAVYPNPANDYITLVNYNNRNLNVNITDVTGKNLKNLQLSEITNNIDISELPSGILFITIQSDQGIKTIRISKN
jgi:hypothetical protein